LGGCLGFEIKKNLLIRRNHALKLLTDQVIALPLFLASVPVIATAALWIKLVSTGPAFYCQMREGMNGRRIPVWKLRTMHMDGDRLLEEWLDGHPKDREQWRRYFKLRHDPRVLPVIGPLLRRTSLDELPQLWSVLRGEMSLVGPRAMSLRDYQLFDQDWQRRRFSVKPGITCLWQVNGRNSVPFETWMELDMQYIDKWSLWLDFKILAQTIPAVVKGSGAA